MVVGPFVKAELESFSHISRAIWQTEWLSSHNYDTILKRLQHFSSKAEWF
jgi:hypothetical protein